MRLEIGRVEAILRYPVKAMCGEFLEALKLAGMGSMATGAWAMRRIDERRVLPWLTPCVLHATRMSQVRRSSRQG